MATTTPQDLVHLDLSDRVHEFGNSLIDILSNVQTMQKACRHRDYKLVLFELRGLSINADSMRALADILESEIDWETLGEGNRLFKPETLKAAAELLERDAPE